MADSSAMLASFPSGDPGAAHAAPGFSCQGSQSNSFARVAKRAAGAADSPAAPPGSVTHTPAAVPSGPATPPTANPAAGAPLNWLPIVDLAGAPCSARQLQRRAAQLSRVGQARLIGRTWHVAPDAEIAGKHAALWVNSPQSSVASAQPDQECGAPAAPPNERDRNRMLQTRLLLRAWSAYRSARRPATARACLRTFGAAPLLELLPQLAPLTRACTTVSEWFARYGLRISLASLRRYRRRLSRDGNADRRGRQADFQAVDQRLRDCFVARACHPNNLHLSQAWRDTRDLAEQLELPLPSRRWWELWFKRNYPQHIVRYAKRPREFDDKNLPKLRREYTETDPLEWVSLDGHVLNVMCRVPDARQGWRKGRPTLTGVLDIRTRMFVGWDIRATEDSDGILAGVKRCLRDWGCPRHYYADNGEAYKASLGHKHRLRRQMFDDPRLVGLAAQTGAERHNAIPYHGWSKMIESHWHTVIDAFERYFPSFWGSNPTDRPEEANRIRIDQLPTIDDVTAAWREYLVAYHAAPQGGDAMNGLSPNLAMEQYRTEVRRLEPDVLDFLCCRLVGPRTVGRDGVKWNNVLYGHFDEQVWRHQGKQVWLRLDPDQAESIWICERSGAPLCRASNRRLTGATQEEVREAARIRARMRKIAAEYAPARDFLLDTNIQQIMRTRARHAQAREQVAREQLPPPAEPLTTLVRPDLVGPVQAAAKEHRRAQVRSRYGQPAAARSNAEQLADELLSMPGLVESEAPLCSPAQPRSQDDWFQELAHAG